MSIQESLKIVPRSTNAGEIALVEWDLVGEKVNKLSTPVMARFKEVVEELARSSYKAVVLISRKPNMFIAGADIEEIKSLKTREQFMPALREAHAIFNRLEDLPMPVIAAINGPCLGGGCELVLACDYRIASDDPSTKIGLPEVKLGIIPGFGGTVRLPRVIGLQASLDIILQGKAVDAGKAYRLGLVDSVVHPSILEEQVMRFVENLIREGKGKRQKRFQPKGVVAKLMESALVRPKVFSEAEKMTLKATSGHYPAPLKALEVIRKTYGTADRERALEIEMNGFCDVAVTDVSKHLINVFFLMESVKRKTGVASGVQPLETKRIGVLGAGTMGGGIAFVAADRGIEVRLKDINHQALALGFSHARDLWEKLRQKKKISAYDVTRKMNLVTGGVDYAGFGQLDVVIEAIVEDMKIKQKVIGETAAHCRSDGARPCIIATNTSSLSVTEMAKGHPHPQNFVGMHFFNPVHKMPLVEVIRGAETSDVAVATIFDLAKKMGKLPVVVKDGPGFIVNRLLVPYLIEAAFLLEDGMAVDVVDKMFKREFGMPMGPFALMDEVGIDVCIKVSKIFHQTLGERIQIPQVMARLGQTDRLGKKNKKGFYLYDDRGKAIELDQKIYSELGLGQPTNKLSSKEVIRRGVYPMINEAALALLEERIVETPEEVDLAMITGMGFPPFRGGLLRYADSVGSQAVADELEVLATQFGARFKPSVPLRNMAKTNRSFY
jgi:3-hydroxyacyl-CoA dehydrogenase/enoyl-CoA hydratase/3-hydroxybutyryl-CoA epimerase